MNRAYRLVWNAAQQRLVTAPEIARSGGRGYRSSGGGSGGSGIISLRLRPIVTAVLVALTLPAWALPVGGQVAAGSGSISQNATVLNVSQSSQNLALNWQSFNIAASETVNFVQPNSSAIALNRVLGPDPSAIYGKLNSNGQVFLVNGNGILFGRGAQINVGGLVASTLDLSPADFMAGHRIFAGTNATSGRIDNLGTLTAAEGGYIALLGGQVSNQGTIAAQLGTVALAVGDRVKLDFAGDKLLSLQVEQGTVNALIENQQLIKADGGHVLLTAQAADHILNGVVNNIGIVQAHGISTRNGVIRLSGDLVVNTGTVDASGSNGGSIDVRGRSLLQGGSIHADGTSGDGGSITLAASGALMQIAAGEITANALEQGGSIALTGGTAAFLSGTVAANGENGGRVVVTAPQLTLAAASLSADGTAQGGTLLVGGDAHGANPDVANATHTTVNPFTTLSAQGRQGKIVVWSDDAMGYYGSAKTGSEGFIEVSGKQTLNYGGQADAGVGGSVLLDPANLVIDASAPAQFYFDLGNPDPAANETHGSGGTTVLSGGNIVVSSPSDGFGAATAGAVYLFNGSTGALISTLVGGSVEDRVGNGGITVLGNGNYVIRSVGWHIGAAANVGAATWGSGSTGVTGVVSSANSLVGSTANDFVGNTITALSNGNYLVREVDWHNGAVSLAGAVTWGSGATGIAGVVSSANSLVGSTAGDQVGSGGFTALANGNYVMNSPIWDNGALINAGAVTWGSGTTGVAGVVSSANSLVGSAASDQVGSFGITPLANGNYVVNSPNWDNGAVADAGAVTWGSGTTGVAGVISSANSLVGSSAFDVVGNISITTLTNGNYVVRSLDWDNGAATNAGAVTWGSGTTGVAGVVSSANSLVGSTAGDQVGSGGFTALANGNYVMNSPIWDNGALINAGAVTWGSGTTGIAGVISSANSLIGSTAGDAVGNNVITALANGNYVVRSSSWDNGAATNAGAVTWGSGTTGVAGVVSSANSLVGSTSSDQVGFSAITALTNGNYVVNSPFWDNGAAPNAGAVTWGSGTTGVAGVVSSANSLVGSSNSDLVGNSGIKALANGNYVVATPSWDNGAATNAGAVTWGSGTTGVSGIVSSANSLVGSATGDNVGSGGVTALMNGNYVAVSHVWANSAVGGAGAATWGNGTTGTTGIVSSANSLVGGTVNDNIGINGIVSLSNSSYLVQSSNWDNGAATNAGAVTWGSGTAGVAGIVSSANSLVGSTANDGVGGTTITALTNGNYVVRSSSWDNGAIADAGAVTWGSGTTGVVGVVSSVNSLIGSTASDAVGNSGITALTNGNYVVNSPFWDNGAATNAGAVTWGSGTTGVTGVISSANSLVGSAANDVVGGSGITAFTNGNYVVDSQGWDKGAIVNAGAVTWGSGTAGVAGVVSSANSLVGSSASDEVGNFGITTLANGNYVVRSPNWDSGAIANAGAVWLIADPSNLASMVNNSIGTATLSPTALAGAAVTGSTVTLQASNNITVNSAVSVAGHLNLVAGNALTLNAGITSTATGDALQLSGLTFTNNVGASALSTPNGRWLVWSGNPANDTRNGLVYDFKQYNAAYGVSTVLGTGNGLLYTLAPTVTASLTGSVTKTYDATLTATLTGANYSPSSGAVDGDTVTLSTPTSGTYDTKNVAAIGKTVSVTGVSVATAIDGAVSVYGYQMAGTPINGNIGAITAKALSMSGLTVPLSKVYDATTAAVVGGSAVLASAEAVGAGSTADGKAYTGDTVSLTGTAAGTYNSKDVATANAVTYSGLSLTGAEAGNYSLTTQSPAAATITAKALTVTGMTAASRAYDGSTVAALIGGSLNGLVGTETLGFSGQSGAFADKDVGTAKAVAVSGVTLIDATGLATNYSVSNPAGLTADITALPGTTPSSAPADSPRFQSAVATTVGPALLINGASDTPELFGNGDRSDADSRADILKMAAIERENLESGQQGSRVGTESPGLPALEAASFPLSSFSTLTIMRGGINLPNKVNFKLR